MFDHLLTGFDIQMKHSPVQTGPSSEEEEQSKSDRISPDEKNSSDIFTVSAEGHWSDVGSMSWGEVIALWKRLVLSTPIPRKNC